VNENLPLDWQSTVGVPTLTALSAPWLPAPTACATIELILKSQVPLMENVVELLVVLTVSLVAPLNKGCGMLLESSVSKPGVALVHPNAISADTEASSLAVLIYFRLGQSHAKL
jgi:hypothetical protein